MLPYACAKRKKPRFKKSEMHGDLPSGTVVSASECRGGARYKYPNKKEVKEENESRETEYMAQKFGLQSHQVMLDDGSGDQDVR
jgi:hypothetical protein